VYVIRCIYHCSILCTLCTVSCSIWAVTLVDTLLYMFAVTNKKKIKDSERAASQSICYVISLLSLSYITGRHSVHKIR